MIRSIFSRPSSKKNTSSLFRDERGLSTVEYVILMAIVVVGAVGTWNQIGTKFKAKLTEANTDVQTIGQ